ncbi:unnamed protein product [Lupinus luteus]|uniref:Uncharacterized protein n=1 Tax=Lupinus luteus TaxID=3873 RepID=A0AAV1XXG0_LUPLU
MKIKFPESAVTASPEEKVTLRILVDEKKNKVVYAEAEKTKYFICQDWWCSRKESGGFLSLFKNKKCKCGKLLNREILPRNSCNCVGFVKDKFTFIIFDDLEDKLAKSRVAQHFKLQKQILPIDEIPIVKYSCYTERNNISGICNSYLTTPQGGYQYACGDIVYDPLTYVEPQSSTSKSGFVKKPSLFMVTNDLVVTPGSFMAVVSFLTMLGFSSSDFDEQIIKIGKRECLSLLKASLISSSTLTDVLGQFIFPIKKETITM